MTVFSFRTDEEIAGVYEKYADTVYRVCFMLLKNEFETQDAVQNVFIKLIKSEKSFESENHVKAWLIVTSQNECKNTLRHWWKSKRVEMDTVKDTPYSSDNEHTDIMDKIITLPDKYKLPIYLHYYEGYSTSEIAQMLNIKHSTLRTQLVTARNKLKLMLEEEDYE